MKKHYTFIPLKDKDLYSFRKALISSLWFRPFSCLLALAVLGIIAYLKIDILTGYSRAMFLFSLAAGLIVYLAILELSKIHQVSTLHKSSLLPFIHTPKEEPGFYSEELSGGFIVQTEPVNLVDIRTCRQSLTLLSELHSEHTALIAYLTGCLNSSDEKLVNKAVIYMEIISSQLEKGNKAILATCDKLTNYKEELL